LATGFDTLIERARSHAPARVSVAAAQDPEVLEAVKIASELGLADFTLVGDRQAIGDISASIGLDLSRMELVHEPDSSVAARRAVELVSRGAAGILMKGLIGTGDLLRAVLDKDVGLRTGRLLSHCAILKSPRYDRFFYLTDGGMVVAPTLAEKVQIIQNAVDVAHKLGCEVPKVACVAAVELVNPDMPATVDAAILAKMSDRRQIRGCIVDGPFGLDNAVSLESAKHKGVSGPVAGQADILLVPDIETGNVIYKTMVHFGEIEAAAIIAGARAPIVLTSRSDSPMTRLWSIALAIVVSG
jgi:phosphate butyryltransferase